MSRHHFQHCNSRCLVKNFSQRRLKIKNDMFTHLCQAIVLSRQGHVWTLKTIMSKERAEASGSRVSEVTS